MQELANQTLAQIVTGNHRTASLFEKYHLDFCCKGKRSLKQACEEQNLSIDQVLGEINAVYDTGKNSSNVEFDNLSLTQLADYIIKTHHEYVKLELPKLYAYLQKVTEKHGTRHPELSRISGRFISLKEELEAHMQKEELVLFPRIRQLESILKQEPGKLNLNISSLLSPITMMQHEHDHAGTLMEEIRQLTNDYNPPPDACTTYRLSFAGLHEFELDLHQHVHLENNILFPKTMELFKKIQETVLN